MPARRLPASRLAIGAAAPLDPQLKFLIQWLAASAAGRQELIYYPFGDDRVKELPAVVEAIRESGATTCRDLYPLLFGRRKGRVFIALLAQLREVEA